MKKIESPKMNSKVLYELLSTSYEQFLTFFTNFKFDFAHKKNKDHTKTNLPSQKVEFQPRKEQLKLLKSKMRFYLQKYQK